MTTIGIELSAAEPSPASARRQALRAALGNPIGAVGAAGALLLLFAAAFGPLLAPYDPLDQNILARFAEPSAQHWLGADEYGRDMFSRILYASRASILIALSSVVVSLLTGVALGVVAAYRGGVLDALLSETANILLAFPTVVVGILVLVSLGPGSTNVVVALAISFIPRFIRLARAEALSIMQRNFIEAARAAGASGLRIMARHILPNVIGTAVVSGALWTATALRAEATLSFLGLGVPLPWPSWGNLVADGMPNMFSNADLVLYPCLAIVFAVVSFNMLGDALRDYFDPRLVGR
jgi:peptide/nickel transport system permease protein